MFIDNNNKSIIKITQTRSEIKHAKESKLIIAKYYCDPIHVEIFIFSIGPRPINVFVVIPFTLDDQFVLRVPDSKTLLDSKNVNM